jgi:hypothetical protein
MTTDFPWENSRLVVPSTLHHLYVGGQPTLFCEARQKLFGLNPTADVIWRSLAQGNRPSEVWRELSDLGLSSAQARTFVEDAAVAWLRRGQLAPSEVLDQRAQPADATRNIRIQELTARISFFGGASVREFDAVFEQFCDDASEPMLTLSVVRCQERYFLFEGDRLLGAYDWEGVMPRLKALLTKRYISRSKTSFLVHGAFLVRRNRGVLLCGACGAGKTTLSVALVASGYEYCSDDIVHLDWNGMAIGTPFAAAVKESAWPIVAPYAPEIDRLPTYLRTDGHRVRFLPLRPSPQTPREINYVLLLSRRAGAAAELESVQPLEVVSTILESAYSTNGAIAPQTLKSFARRIEAAGCYRLVYPEVAEAVRAVNELIGE